MTEIAGATRTYELDRGNREDLWDVISNISPMDRPYTHNIDLIRAKATRHDWLTDSLAAATSNKHLEGDVTSFSTAIAITKLANTCQILKKAFVVTGTQEAVDKAGRRPDFKYQLQKASNELLRDLEWTALSTQIGSVGSQTLIRVMAGAEAWIPSTDNSGNGVQAHAIAAWAFSFQIP